MQCEDAYRSRVTEHCDPAAVSLRDDLVELLPGTVEQLAVTLATGQHVLEVTAEQRRILFRMLLGRIFKRETFHHADAAFPKCICALDWQAGQVCEWSRRFHRAREVTRIDRGQRFCFESAGSCFCLFTSARRQRRGGVPAKTAFS